MGPVVHFFKLVLSLFLIVFLAGSFLFICLEGVEIGESFLFICLDGGEINVSKMFMNGSFLYICLEGGEIDVNEMFENSFAVKKKIVVSAPARHKVIKFVS